MEDRQKILALLFDIMLAAAMIGAVGAVGAILLVAYSFARTQICW